MLIIENRSTALSAWTSAACAVRASSGSGLGNNKTGRWAVGILQWQCGMAMASVFPLSICNWNIPIRNSSTLSQSPSLPSWRDPPSPRQQSLWCSLPDCCDTPSTNLTGFVCSCPDTPCTSSTTAARNTPTTPPLKITTVLASRDHRRISSKPFR